MQGFLLKYKNLCAIVGGCLIIVIIIIMSNLNKTTYITSLVPATIQKLVSDLYEHPDYGVKIGKNIEGEQIGMLRSGELADVLMDTYGSWIKESEAPNITGLPNITFTLEAEKQEYKLNFYETDCYIAQIIEGNEVNYYTLDTSDYKRITYMVETIRYYNKYLQEERYATVIAYKDGKEVAREDNIDLARTIRDWFITGEVSRMKSDDTTPSVTMYLEINFGDDEIYYMYAKGSGYYIEHVGHYICHVPWEAYKEVSGYVGIKVTPNNMEDPNKKPGNPPNDIGRRPLDAEKDFNEEKKF